MANTTARQDLRRIVAAPETTLGTHTTTNGVILPLSRESRLQPAQEVVEITGADGYAGGLPSVVARQRIEGELLCHLHDGGTNPFPPFVLMLLAMGFEISAYTDGVYTIVPSTKPVAVWPGFTAGTRSPCALSLTEVFTDNNAADEQIKAASCTLAGKLAIMRNAPIVIGGSVKGLVVSSTPVAIGTDLSALGSLSASQGTTPAVGNGTWACSIVTDAGSDAVTLDGFEGVEISFDPTHELQAGTVDGYAMAPVLYVGPMSGSITTNLSRLMAAEWWPALAAAPSRVRLSLSYTHTFSSGAEATMTIPFAQVTEPKLGERNGVQTVELPLKIVRSAFGSATAPITFTYEPAAA